MYPNTFLMFSFREYKACSPELGCTTSSVHLKVSTDISATEIYATKARRMSDLRRRSYLLSIIFLLNHSFFVLLSLNFCSAYRLEYFPVHGESVLMMWCEVLATVHTWCNHSKNRILSDMIVIRPRHSHLLTYRNVVLCSFFPSSSIEWPCVFFPCQVPTRLLINSCTVQIYY